MKEMNVIERFKESFVNCSYLPAITDYFKKALEMGIERIKTTGKIDVLLINDMHRDELELARSAACTENAEEEDACTGQ